MLPLVDPCPSLIAVYKKTGAFWRRFSICQSLPTLFDLPAVAFLELLATTAGAGVITPDILQGIARRLLHTMLAVRSMHVIVIVLAVRTVYVGLVHAENASEL